MNRNSHIRSLALVIILACTGGYGCAAQTEPTDVQKNEPRPRAHLVGVDSRGENDGPIVSSLHSLDNRSNPLPSLGENLGPRPEPWMNPGEDSSGPRPEPWHGTPDPEEGSGSSSGGTSSSSSGGPNNPNQ